MKIGFYHGKLVEFMNDRFDSGKFETLIERESDDVHVGMVFRLNDKFYSVHHIYRTKGFARVKQIELTDGESKYGEPEITCPYCGDQDTDSWEMDENYEDERECGVCGGVFSIVRNVEVTYSTTPFKAPEIEEF